MTLKVGINGFGRIGRLALRAAWGWPKLEFVRINDPAGDSATHAHLLNFDSVHGRWQYEAGAEGDAVVIDGKRIAVSANKAIADTDWSGCDLVIEASGKMKTVAVLQAYAIADVGNVAYESPGPDGAVEGMIIDEGIIVEIVRPGTGDPVPEGEVGEVVVTAFNRDYPMIRLATGDLSAVLPGRSPCGRTNMRIRGWLGRADQTTKVKGMFVHPEQVAEVAKRFPELGRVRLVVTRAGEQDVMTLKAEGPTTDTALATQIGDAVQQATKLKSAVEIVAPGTLPNDGKIIADDRSYE